MNGFYILDRYIIRKFLGTFIFSIILIVCIAVVFDLSEKLDDFLEKSAPVKAIIFDYYLNFIPHFAVLFSYLFTFVSVIFFTSKMAYNTEIIAILSSGVSFRRLLVPFFISAFIIALGSFLLSNYVIPKANIKRFQFEELYYRNNPVRVSDHNIHKQIELNIFVYLESYNTSTDVGRMFSMEKFEKGQLKSKLFSSYVKWDSVKSKWIIHNYYIRTIDGNKETITKGGVMDTTINMLPSDFKKRRNVVEAMTLTELNDYIAELKLAGSTELDLVVIEKAKRIAYPFSSFILTLLGVCVSSRKMRGGMGGQLGFGLAASFAYILFMQFSSQFAVGGFLNPHFAVWIPNIIFLILGLYLYRITPK
jgi:lipopolysaccharide export system permease protein